jgi:hypothetical protein
MNFFLRTVFKDYFETEMTPPIKKSFFSSASKMQQSDPEEFSGGHKKGSSKRERESEGEIRRE